MIKIKESDWSILTHGGKSNYTSYDILTLPKLEVALLLTVN